MPRSSKPKRQYRARPVVNPLNMRNPWNIEGQAHAALMAVNGNVMTEDTTTMIAAHADVVRRIAEKTGEKTAMTHANGIIRVICAIQIRGQASGNYKASELEAVTLNTSIGFTAEWLSGRKNMEILKASVDALRALNALGGVRVNYGS